MAPKKSCGPSKGPYWAPANFLMLYGRDGKKCAMETPRDWKRGCTPGGVMCSEDQKNAQKCEKKMRKRHQKCALCCKTGLWTCAFLGLPVMGKKPYVYIKIESV